MSQRSSHFLRLRCVAIPMYMTAYRDGGSCRQYGLILRSSYAVLFAGAALCDRFKSCAAYLMAKFVLDASKAILLCGALDTYEPTCSRCSELPKQHAQQTHIAETSRSAVPLSSKSTSAGPTISRNFVTEISVNARTAGSPSDLHTNLDISLCQRTRAVTHRYL